MQGTTDENTDLCQLAVLHCDSRVSTTPACIKSFIFALSIHYVSILMDTVLSVCNQIFGVQKFLEPQTPTFYLISRYDDSRSIRGVQYYLYLFAECSGGDMCPDWPVFSTGLYRSYHAIPRHQVEWSSSWTVHRLLYSQKWCVTYYIWWCSWRIWIEDFVYISKSVITHYFAVYFVPILFQISLVMLYESGALVTNGCHLVLLNEKVAWNDRSRHIVHCLILMLQMFPVIRHQRETWTAKI